MTRRQLSRHQREVRRQRIALIAVAAALAVALFIPIYGYWRETYAKGGEAIAVVQGQPISTELYARFLGYQEQVVEAQAKRLSDATATATDDAAKQSLQLQQQNLQQRAQSLSDDALAYLVERPFVLSEAGKRGLTASPQEIDRALQQEMSSYPNYGLRYQSLSDVPDDKLVSLDKAKSDLKALLGSSQFLTEDQVRDLVLTQRVLRGKILAALSEGVPTSGEQVQARHILVDTEDKAKAARDRIAKGEDFAAVAKEVSTDTGSKDKGGDLGWFTRDQMIKEFADAAFSLPVNEVSQPVKTTYGYHLIQTLEKADNRPFERAYVDQLKGSKFADWISSQETADGAVEKLDSQDKLSWADKYVSDRLSAAK